MVVAAGCLENEGTRTLHAPPNPPPSVALRHNVDTTYVHMALYLVHSGLARCAAGAGPFQTPKWYVEALDAVCPNVAPSGSWP